MSIARQVTTRILAEPRRLLLAGTSLLALGAPALAADLPAKAPLPVAVASSWAGFYLGVHGGYGWKQDEFSTNTGFPIAGSPYINGVHSQGAVYGAHAGYNWQFGRALTGLELDFSATDIKGSNGINYAVMAGPVVSASETVRFSESVKYLGSARARLGWLPIDNVLLYGTAGLAWERMDLTTDTNLNQPLVPGSNAATVRTAYDKFGWVAGAGAEVMLGSPNWIGRVEYLHYDMGQLQSAWSLAVTGQPLQASTAGAQTIDVVRGGVSYKFGEPAARSAVSYAKAPVAATPLGWAGFYLGVHGGYAWGDDPQSYPLVLNMFPAGTLSGLRSTGWAAGGHFGHNWQYDRVVAGLEADLSAANIKGTTNTDVQGFGGGTFVSTTLDEKVKYLGTARGRLGFVPMNNLLLYGTAGLAWERFELGSTQAQTLPAGSISTRVVTPTDRFGWVAGAGGETTLGSTNWIGRLEYLHYDFGRVNPDISVAIVQPGTNINAATSHGRQTIELLRAGVSYKFGPDAPMPAAAPAMYAKAPRMAPAQGWAGFYLGAHGGYGWKDNDFERNFYLNGFVGGIKSQGWLGGGHAGYNWQYASLVAGVEIDGTATGIKGSSAPSTVQNLTETLSGNTKFLGTARGRLGWTPVPTWLLYGTGGLAWERGLESIIDVSNLGGGKISTEISETPGQHFGWVAGVGAETFVGSSNWIARLEYLHYDFGTVAKVTTTTSTVAGVATIGDRGGRQSIETVRAGLSYKFTP